mmetsp:Transcript_10330/g.34195  ORF Transcript_10330/g.34195 Transcript_10330/m.34195 type:complete len:268 (-) Transcript_10330:136-939(-)
MDSSKPPCRCSFMPPCLPCLHAYPCPPYPSAPPPSQTDRLAAPRRASGTGRACAASWIWSVPDSTRPDARPMRLLLGSLHTGCRLLSASRALDRVGAVAPVSLLRLVLVPQAEVPRAGLFHQHVVRHARLVVVAEIRAPAWRVEVLGAGQASEDVQAARGRGRRFGRVGGRPRRRGRRGRFNLRPVGRAGIVNQASGGCGAASPAGGADGHAAVGADGEGGVGTDEEARVARSWAVVMDLAASTVVVDASAITLDGLAIDGRRRRGD